METLLRSAIQSAYGNPTRRQDNLPVVLYPTRQSNLPDDHRQAHLGIINPDHWNWTDAQNAANGMSPRDIVDIHSHSSNDNGPTP